MKPAASYEAMRAQHRWRTPERFNMGVAVCDRQPPTRRGADPPAYPAITRCDEYTFGELEAAVEPPRQCTRRHTGWSAATGSASCCRKSPETAVAHIAIYKAGLVVDAVVRVCSAPMRWSIPARRFRRPCADHRPRERGQDHRDPRPPAGDLELVSVDRRTRATTAPAARWTSITNLTGVSDQASDPVDTAAEEPGLLIYTSGTTGPPKGALHAHRVP